MEREPHPARKREGAMLRAGDWVEVRTKTEILETLDAQGRHQGLPFMPEMFQYCGRRFQIYKTACKSCDTVSGKYIGLSVKHGVHLEHRCDGNAHGGCQAGCLIFWKEAWLRPADGNAESLASPVKREAAEATGARCTEDTVEAAAKATHNGETVYSCQATALLNYARPVKWWDARQYAEAYRSGNKSAIDVLRGLTYLAFCYGTRAHSQRFGALPRWLYDRARPLWGGVPFPRKGGEIPAGQATPRSDLDLKPGDLVQVKSYDEIRATLYPNGSNRGLFFDAESVPYCGNVYRVKTRIQRFIDERTGKMKTLKTPAVILEGVVCKSRFSGQRIFCSREIHLWWREIWLKRAETPAPAIPKRSAEGLPQMVTWIFRHARRTST
jgi:hypothetical protein